MDSAEKGMKFVRVFYNTHYKTTASGHRDAVKGHLDKMGNREEERETREGRRGGGQGGEK